MKSNSVGLFSKWSKLQSWQKILLALVAGVLVGLTFGPQSACLKPIGTIFIRGITMMVSPVVFTSIVCAVISINDPQKMRRLGFKTILLYTISMAIAATIGICTAISFSLGHNFHLDVGAASIAETPSIIDMIVNMMPSNPASAFAQGNIIQILVFALLLGMAINLAGEKAEPIAKMFRAFSHVVFKLTSIVMSFAPIGIFALMAWVAGEFGLTALLPLLKFVFALYLACLLQWVLFYAPFLAIFARLNPIQFFRRIVSPMLLAFSSSSSAATLPVTMKTAEENLGISPSIARFLLPLGMSLNMNGMSVFLGMATVFTSNIYGVHLGLTEYLTVLFTIILTGMGAGGVPGTGIIALSAVMASVGLPLGAVPLLAGIDRINDMAQTTTNVVGDLFTATVIARGENELDLTAFYAGSETESEATKTATESLEGTTP